MFAAQLGPDGQAFRLGFKKRALGALNSTDVIAINPTISDRKMGCVAWCYYLVTSAKNF